MRRKHKRERTEAQGPLRLANTMDGYETHGCPLCAELRAFVRLAQDARACSSTESQIKKLLNSILHHEDATGHYTMPSTWDYWLHMRLLWKQGGSVEGMEALHEQKIFLVKVDQLRTHAAVA